MLQESIIQPEVTIFHLGAGLGGGLCVYSVTQLCPILCNPVDCSPPGFSVHGIFLARILEWVAIFLLQEIFPIREGQTHVCCIGRKIHRESNVINLPLGNWQRILEKLVLEKAEEPEITLPTSAGSSKSKRVPEKHLFLLY